ncbi:MAG TPA: hypothetical protein PK941_07830 [Paludibacter sp.]|nr:hypothetical protein [Paludibacter sp.]
MMKSFAYFEPGSCGSPACLPLEQAVREFNNESLCTMKYGAIIFPPAKLTLYFTENRKLTEEVLIGGIHIFSKNNY